MLRGGQIMEGANIYDIIAKRTNGDIYVGVVRAGSYRQIHLYQAFYGYAGASQHRKRL